MLYKYLYCSLSPRILFSFVIIDSNHANTEAKSVFTSIFLSSHFNAKLTCFINTSNSATFMWLASVFFLNQAASSCIAQNNALVHFWYMPFSSHWVLSLHFIDNTLHDLECTITYSVFLSYLLCLSLYITACSRQPSSYRVVINKCPAGWEQLPLTQLIHQKWNLITPPEHQLPHFCIFMQLELEYCMPLLGWVTPKAWPLVHVFWCSTLPLLLVQLTHPPGCHQ